MIPDKKYVDIISNQPQTKGDQTYINNENIEVTTNGTYVAEAPYTGFGQVKVNVPNGTETLNVSENGTYTPSGTNIGFRSVNVNVPQPQLVRLDVTPTTSQQTLTPTGSVSGYSPVVVAAVTSAIDSNIKASNIKSGVTVLGVTGNVIESNTRSLSVTPTTSLQTFAPQSPYNGFSGVSVAAVTAAIDANITAGNIKAGTTILGVNGSVVELKGTTLNKTMTSVEPSTIYPTSPYNAFTSVNISVNNYPTNTTKYEISPSTITRDVAVPTGFSGFNMLRVNAVTSAIDGNIQPSNIKSGVTILGVTGSYSADINIEPLIVSPSTTSQIINTTAGVDGYAPITVNAVTASIDANILSNNIRSGVNILGVTGNVVELKGETRTESLTSASGNTFTPSSGKNGITSITVVPNNENRAVVPTTTQQVLSVNNGYSGNGTITISPVTSAIDSDIQAGNIKEGVNILGVTGTAKIAPEFYLTRKTVNNELLVDSSNTPILPNSSSLTSIGYGALAFSEIDFGNNAIDFSSLASINYAYSFFSARLKGSASVDLSNVTTISGLYSCYYMFSWANITSVDLSSLTSISNDSACLRMFGNCSNLTNIIGNSLTTISGTNVCNYMFAGCTGLTGNINFLSSLETITGVQSCNGMFEGCTNITSVNLDNLESVGVNSFFYMFNESGITNMSFPKLTSISSSGFGYAFRNCLSLTTVSFGALTSTSFHSTIYIFGNMLQGCSDVTVHFPSNLQSVIGSWSDVVNGFGGTNTTVLFDLPATE